MRHTIEVACQECKSTGLYVGLGEHNGAAVVCCRCKGTGKTTVTYDDFERRKRLEGIQRVYQANPGVVIGEGDGHTLEGFGGISYLEWAQGAPFGPGTEMRNYSCPAQWFQCADSDRKPHWDECHWGRFSACPHYGSKAVCWKRFDSENR